MTSAEMRRWLAALRSIERSLSSIIEQQVNNARTNSAAANEHQTPQPERPIIVQVVQRSNAEAAADDAQQRQERAFQRGTLIVQWALFVATMLAFGAAAYYAHIASLQEDTMERQWQTLNGQWQTLRHQWATMSNTLTEIQRQTPVFAGATRAATRQAATGEEALHTTEAADMQLDHVECSTVPNPLSINATLAYVWRNSGRTTATDVTNVLYGGIPTRRSRPITGGSVGTVGAGSPYHAEPLLLSMSISQADLDNINSQHPTFQLHLWGWVIYRDRFQRPHITVIDSAYIPNSVCGFLVQKISSR